MSRKSKRVLTEAQAEELAIRNRTAWKRAPAHSTAQARRAAVKPKSPTEFTECRTFIAWTKLVMFDDHPLYDRVVKIPNERGAGGASIALLAAIGMRNGFPDYAIHAPSGDQHGLYLEAKRVTDGHCDPEQLEWRDKLRRWGYHAEICEGATSLIGAVIYYMTITGAAESGLFVDRTRFTA